MSGDLHLCWGGIYQYRDSVNKKKRLGKLTGQAPFVAGKILPGFEHPENLCKNPRPVGCMARRFNRIHPIKRAVGKRQCHEVSVYTFTHRLQPRLSIQLVPTRDLIFVDGYTCDLGSSKTGDIPGRVEDKRGREGGLEAKIVSKT